MAKYYIIKIESVISAFTFSEAGRETTFEWNFPFPQSIAVGDSLLGVLMDTIHEVTCCESEFFNTHKRI